MSTLYTVCCLRQNNLHLFCPCDSSGRKITYSIRMHIYIYIYIYIHTHTHTHTHTHIHIYIYIYIYVIIHVIMTFPIIFCINKQNLFHRLNFIHATKTYAALNTMEVWSIRVIFISIWDCTFYRGAGKSLARPRRKQTIATKL